MNKKIQVTCKDERETRLAGESVGKLLKAHDLVEIKGDIGAGKTTFVQGIASGLGCEQDVTSPTFTISQVYSGRLDLAHYDLHRLNEPGLALHEISEVINEPNTAVAIEWSDIAGAVLPKKRFVISIAPSSQDERKITINLPEDTR